jgi:hypothetical protein
MCGDPQSAPTRRRGGDTTVVPAANEVGTITGKWIVNAEELMLAVAGALESAQLPCMLVGAFSSSYHGIPRSTEDADFVVALEELPIATLAAHLGMDFTIDPQAKIETFTMGTYYTIRHATSDFSVDLFLLQDDPHDLASYGRRIPVSYGSGKVYLSSAEDLIITKLRWSQGGRRNKDIDDARGVLAVQQPTNLDLAYIRQWTDQHGTRKLFERLLSQIQMI